MSQMLRVPSLCRLLLACGLLCFILCEIAQAQKLNRKRPGVYITFKEFVKKTADENNPREGARLVLHNNTKWPIYFSEASEGALPGDVAGPYQAEQEDGRYVWLGRIDVVSEGKVMPGKLVNFTVPLDDFPERGLIYVPFSYSWERRIRWGVLRGEAEHRAKFISGNLPRRPSE
jgi:hypothetical protein